MASMPTMEQILELSIEERIELVQSIWNSIAAVPDALPLSDEQRRIVAERLEAYMANPGTGKSWEEIRARLLNES